MKIKLAILSFLMLAACARPGIDINWKGDPETQSAVACAAFAPIYLSEGAIAALKDFRTDKELIAAHNRTHERLCQKD